MKNLIYTMAIVLMTAFVAVGCGKKRSNNAGACAYGQVHNGYTCVNNYGGGYGGYGNGGWGGGVAYNTEIVASFSSSNQQVYGSLLRANGYCSRYMINIGTEKCSKHNNGGSVVLRLSGTSGSAMAELGSTTNQLYSNPVYAGMIPRPNNPYAAPIASSPVYAYGEIQTEGANLVFRSYNTGLVIYLEGTTLNGVNGGIRMQLNFGNQPFANAIGRRRL